MDLLQTIFQNGGFDAESLTVSINKAPYSPRAIAQRKLFREIPIDTTEAVIELINRDLTLVQSSPRGGIGDMHPRTGRSVVKFKAPHLRTRGTLMADSWQDRRGFGEKALASVEKEKDRELAEHRDRLEATIEFHRVRALAGKILDADGSELVDLLAEFDVSQNTHDVDLDTSSVHVPTKIVEAKRKSEAELGDVKPTGWVAFCSASFMDALRSHPSVAQFAEGWAAAAVLRDDVRDDLGLANCTFVEMRNAAGVTFVEDGAAYLVPEGVPNLLVTHFAPADYVDTANTEGLPLYARGHLLPFGRGISIESQTNPISIVTRPRAIVKLTA